MLFFGATACTKEPIIPEPEPELSGFTIHMDKKFCTDYAEWLQSEPLTPQGKPLAQATACSCFWILGIILSAAWRKGYIKSNPWKLLSFQEKIARPESKREFLTLDKVRKLEDTPYIKENIRKAFLFACYCGLRVGDVTDLRWSDISVNGGRHFVSVVMQKNSKPISLPLPAKALSWLPERGEPEAPVFSLPSHTILHKHLRKWAELAGLERHLHFHLIRHTYGTMLITAGLAHYDRDQRHSYEEIFRIMRQMNLPYPEQEELYRRMMFNVMNRNHDDHSKNFSFLMDRQGTWKLAPAYDPCYSYTPGGKWTNRHQLSLNGKQDNFTMEDLQKVGENMGIREHKQIIEKVQETVSHWHETAKDCGVKPEHADFIGKNLLLFSKQLHTIQIPDIVNEQEQAFMKAMRNDDFNTILELKMRGYQPSENVLKSLQPDVSSTTFIAAAKIFQMEGMLKSLQDIKPAQSPIIGGNKRSMELGD